VPWVTSWSSEAICGVRPCPTIGGRLAICQEEKPGFGRPQYSKNHLRRQRASVLDMLCPMCGEPTAMDDRWTQVARRVPAGVLRARGMGAALPPEVPDAEIVVDAGAIAPLHRICAERSLEHCPHLRAEPNVKLMRFPERWSVFPLTVEVTPALAPLHVLAKPEPRRALMAVIGFIQLCGLSAELDPKWGSRRSAAPNRAQPDGAPHPGRGRQSSHQG